MTDDALRETFLSGEEVFHGKLSNVEHWQVRLPDGQTALREVVKHRGAAAVVPIDDDGNVTLVRQHRVAVGRFTWELPAGKLDAAQENPLAAARRELEEETGLRAENWRFLTKIDTTPGFCTEQISIFLATGLSQHHDHPDADEFLRLTKMPLEQAVALCMGGELCDSKTIIGLMMAQRLLHAGDAPALHVPAQIERIGGAYPSHAGK